MSQITPALIKELRERTGVGMAKCKEALEEAKGSLDGAIDLLRKAGMASAVKKEGRETKEGTIIAKEGSDVVAVAEINAETDFVVKNEKFQEFCRNISDELIASKPASLDAFLKQNYSKDPSITIEGLRSLIIQVIGENIQIKRIAVMPKAKNRSFGIYSHMGGKILTVVELEGENEEALAKDIAMHVAAGVPVVAEYVKPEEVPAAIIEKEREIARGQMAGKPANIIEKILDGKINAFFDTVCLIRQKFIKDDSMSIGELIKKRSEATGKPISLVNFIRWTIGQA
ncbi:MAG: tsf [Chlamydiia bacterium]|nr:tsf [Chlamydiia bacterium]